MIVAISPFSDSESSGHSLLDDLFYFEYLLKRREPFRFYVPPLSAERLAARFPGAGEHIQSVEPYVPSGLGHFKFASQLKVEAGAKVIFFGYLERLVLVWYLINLFCPFSLRLVATNNICAGRLQKYGAQMRLFFHTIRRKLQRIVLHTGHEARLLDQLIPGLARIAYVKKHHLMIPNRRPCVQAPGDSIVISFFGPPKPDKPLQPFLDMIAADRTGRFHYRIHNQSTSDIVARMGLDRLPDHVSVSEGWRGYEAYLDSCAASDIIFMTHNREFEGKLSGNLCDCVALGVPYICADMEPMRSLHAKYGALGYACDFDQSGWPGRLLDSISAEDLASKKSALERMANDYSIEHIQADLDAALCL